MNKFFSLFLCIFCSASLAAAESGLERLLQGNKRYVNDALTHPNRTSERREAIVSTQTPFATIVSCADSRVAPEILFDQGVGDLFVVRVAGNVIGPIELDSIEYSVLYLKSSVIIVMGHENCGAVDAVIKGTTKDIESVAELIEPAVLRARKSNPANLLEASVKANAINMKNHLMESPALKPFLAKKQLEIFAAYYDLNTGSVKILSD